MTLFIGNIKSEEPPSPRLAFQLPLLPKKVKTVAKETILELGTILGLVSVASCFVYPESSVGSLLELGFQVFAVNTLLRTVKGAASCLIKKNHSLIYKVTRTACTYLPPIAFSQLHCATTNLLIHEGGHALAAMAVYKNAEPRIAFYQLWYGSTELSKNRVPRFFSEERSFDIVLIGGPALAVFSSCTLIATAKLLQKTSPKIRLYLTAAALATVAGHIRYAWNALNPKEWESNNDFVHLWRLGLNPPQSIALIAGLPIITYLAIDET